MFVTSRVQEADLVAGLQAGADDYLVKPIRGGEFIARLNALARRVMPAPLNEEKFRCGLYEIGPVACSISFKGQPVQLGPKEFELALLFFRNPSRLFSRDVLSQSV